MDLEPENPKLAWVRRVLEVEVSSRSSNPVSQLDQDASDDMFEGPIEQGKEREASYNNLLLRIDAELKDFGDWKDPGYFVTRFAGDREIQAFVRNILPSLEVRYQALENNKPIVANLAAQADFRALRTHVEAASTLLADIATSVRGIGQLVSKPQQGTFDNRKKILTKLLTMAPDGNAAEVSDIKTRLANVEERDVTSVNAMITEASALVEADKLRGELKDALTKLATDAGKFPKLNPVSKRLDTLIDQTAEADALPPGSTRNLMWSSALAEATEVRTSAATALPVRTEILNTLHVAEVAVQQTSKTAVGRDGMLDLIKPVRASIISECAKATKVENVKTNWNPLKVEANAVAQQIADWCKTLIVPEKVEKDLAELLDMTNGFGFETFEQEPKNQKLAEEIRKRANTDPKTLASMDATTLRVFDEQVVKTVKMVMKVLVDTAAPEVLAKEMDERAAKEEDAKGAAQVEFWKAALEKRMGLKINIPEGVEASKLPSLYKLISRMPPSQVIKDLVDNFDYDTQAGPCLYNKRKIIMTNMSKEIPEDAAHKLQYPTTDGSATEMVDYFNLLTLHEIGHSVDDKRKIMPRAAGAEGPGGWKNESFDDVVTKLAARMRTGGLSVLPEPDVLAMVREFLMTGKVNKPPSARAPLGSLLASWDALTGILDPFAATTIARKTPWENPVVLEGGRCYHEGYAGRWFSYEKGSRDGSSISLYQWRAPGEWFAELYAWHYMGKDPLERATRASRLPADVKDAITA